MDQQILLNLISAMEQSALSVLEVEFDGTRIHMEKPVSATVARSAGSDAASFGVIGGAGTRGTASYPNAEGPVAPEAVEAAPQTQTEAPKRAGYDRGHEAHERDRHGGGRRNRLGRPVRGRYGRIRAIDSDVRIAGCGFPDAPKPAMQGAASSTPRMLLRRDVQRPSTTLIRYILQNTRGLAS